MQQVLFHIPLFKSWFPPDGIPIHGFGVMLFITFIACVWYFGRRSERTGTNMPRDRVQDLVMVMFVGGLAGARVTYMIQYGVPLTLGNFIRIWEGGIVLYGGVITGILLFVLIYYKFLKKFGVHFWKLSDAVAPSLALGIALGRIGCFLNGCCYGHIAPDDCPQVHFPTYTASAREVLVDKQHFQTENGFLTSRRGDDIRSVVTHVEVGSSAQRAGLKVNDRIVEVDDLPNGWVLTVTGPEEMLASVRTLAEHAGARIADTNRHLKVVADDPAAFRDVRKQIADLVKDTKGAGVYDTDQYSDLQAHWPHGHQSISLGVERDGKREPVMHITPRLIGLHPTQLYETISMLLLMGFLVTYYPFRRHDGQVFALFLACYAVHRFLNEMLRNDTGVVGFKMTLSQNISIIMFVLALGLEMGLRITKQGRRDVPQVAVKPT